MKRFVTLISALVLTAGIAHAQLEVLDFSIDMTSSTGAVTVAKDVSFSEPVELYSYILYNSSASNVVVELDAYDLGVSTEIASAVTNTPAGSTSTVITPTALAVTSGAITNVYAVRPVAKTIRVTAVRGAAPAAAHGFLRGRIYGNRTPISR